jgi:multidrug efflux pump
MRIWLDPDKLHGYGMSAAQALAAVRGQNVQVAPVGSDRNRRRRRRLHRDGQAEGRFTSPEQFEDIILRADSDGTTVRLKDVARSRTRPVQLWPARRAQRRRRRRPRRAAGQRRQRA